MAASKKATQKTGVTHYPPEEETNNQKRLPPRGKAKEQRKTASQSRDERAARLPTVTTVEERTISGLGTKGGKSSGSWAGLISAGKKTRRT